MAQAIGNNAGGRAQKANRAASRRLQTAHRNEFDGYLREERIKVGLHPEPSQAYSSVVDELERAKERIAELERRYLSAKGIET
jgi:hypothetical protein